MKATTNRGRPGLFAQLLGYSKSAAEEPEDDKDKAEEEDEEAAEEEGDDKDKAEDEEAAEGEDDDKDDDKEAKATRAERRRCARIIAHGIKIGAVEQAGVLAFDSDLPAKAAISTLDALAGSQPGAKARGNLANRMSTVKTPTVGQDGAAAPGADTPQGLAARMVGAYQKATGQA